MVIRHKGASMSVRRITARKGIASVLAVGLIGAGCSTGDGGTPSTAAPASATNARAAGVATTTAAAIAATGLATTTPAGTKPVDKITWALYRDVTSLDPVQAFDYPENTVLAILCEAPLHQAPDGTI